MGITVQNQKDQSEQPVVSSSSLSQKEEEAIKKRLSYLEDTLDNKEITQGLNYQSQNPAETEKEIKHLRRILETRSVQIATGQRREEVLKRIKILEDDLRKDMPPWGFYSRTKRSDGIAYVNLVNKIMKWETDPVRRKKVMEWKNLRRQLDPSDPQIANTMHLFPGQD